MKMVTIWRKKAAGFLALAAVMGVLQWNWFAMPLERDEGEYAYAAWLIRTGKGVPYRDSFLQKPPGIVWTYWLVETLAPESDKVGFRVAGFLASMATAWLVWRLAQRELGGRAGVWGAWLWAAFSQQWSMFNSVAANVEKFMVVPMLGAMAMAGRGERRWWRWALAGGLAAAAVLYKPICVPVLVGWFFWAVLAKPRQRTGGSPPTPSMARPTAALQEAAGRLGWLTLGGGAAAAAALGWFAWKGALGAMWECAVEYTGAYAGLANPFRDAWTWGKTFATWKLGMIVALAFGGLALRRREGWPWMALFVVASLVGMTDLNGHYYLMALPLAAIGAGAGIDRLASWFGQGKDRGCRLWGMGMSVAAFGALMTGMEGAVLVLGCTPRQLSAILYNGNPFVEAEDAGKAVSWLCSADGTVHIMGSEAEILWYARRKSTTRFVIAYPMTLPTRYARQYQKEALEKLREEAPAVVVSVRTWMGFLGPPEVSAGYFRDTAEMILGGGYRLEWSFVQELGGWVQGGDWGDRVKAGASMGIWRRVAGEQ